MQEQSKDRRTHGAKAIAIDNRVLIMRYRLFQLTAAIVAAALALGLHLIFAR
ncbi:MAG TPA: hypothetical protein VL485_30965 [Ktedonobacteraceae bacterium]|jgi:hypothetical protein|nr:hypothetical protein [Ktedonobacteraceae bacterium]